jgi:acyl-CoA thioesterase FadM
LKAGLAVCVPRMLRGAISAFTRGFDALWRALAQEVRRGADVLVKASVHVAFISEGRAQPIPKALRSC